MNISKYDSVIELADTENDKFVAPSEFDMIKKPPTKMNTEVGAPVVTEDTERIILREPSAFAQWAYLKMYGMNGKAERHYLNNGNLRDTITVPTYYESTSSKYLLRSIDEFVKLPAGAKWSAQWPSLNRLAKVVTNDGSLYGMTTKEITEFELQNLYPDYEVRDLPSSGATLTLERMKPLNSVVKMARDVLSGGVGDYKYYSPLAITLGIDTSSDGFVTIGKRYATTTSLVDRTVTISQGIETRTDTYASGLILHADFPSDMIGGFDVYLSYSISYNSEDFAALGTWVTGGSKGKKTVVKGPLQFEGNTLDLHNYDIGLTSFDDIVNMAKQETGWDFLTVDSSTYTGQKTFERIGSAEYGELAVADPYAIVFPKLSVDMN